MNQFFAQPFQDGVRYHIETSPLICSANQWTGFYIIAAPVMKELKTHALVKLTMISINKPIQTKKSIF